MVTLLKTEVKFYKYIQLRLIFSEGDPIEGTLYEDKLYNVTYIENGNLQTIEAGKLAKITENPTPRHMPTSNFVVGCDNNIILQFDCSKERESDVRSVNISNIRTISEVLTETPVEPPIEEPVV
jgi:hypothetical protein